MTNPFTKYLSQWLRRPDIEPFIAHWDELERIVVQVYKGQMALDEADELFAQVWPWLRAHYGQWQEALRPYWQQTKAAGKPTQTDPFQLLIALESPAAILDNWTAMQHLPAAREALNHFVLAHSK